MSNLKEQFLHGMSKAASSVYIVTTNGLAGKRGITVSAVSEDLHEATRNNNYW